MQDQRQGLLAAIGDRLTAAVLADKLGDDFIDPICDCLARRSIPFLFLAGDSDKHAQKWAPAPIRSKAFDGRAFIEDLVRLLVTGGDTLDLDDTTRIDRIIFGAQSRLQRQEGIVAELTSGQHDLGNAVRRSGIETASCELLSLGTLFADEAGREPAASEQPPRRKPLGYRCVADA